MELSPAVKGGSLPKNKLCIILPDEDGQNEYCCVECPARYKEKDKLEIHLCSDHNKEYRFLCGICGTGLKRKEHLDRHLLGHQEVRPYLCIDCGKGFKRKEHLNIHKSIHSGDKSHLCPFCDRSFYRKDHLQKHLQTHNKGSEVELSGVKIEPLEFIQIDHDQNMSDAVNHGNENLTIDPERPYGCPICHKTYKRKDHLKLHSYTHMEKDKICSECGKAFHKEEQLLAHMDVHLDQPMIQHDDSDEFHPLVIITDELLIPRARNMDSRPHACDICGKRFKRKQHLKVHANVHRNAPAVASIWCSLCSEGFHNNDQFERHECLSQSTQHGTDTFIYPDKSFTDQYDESYEDNGYSDMKAEFVDNEDIADHENYIRNYEQMTVENLSLSPAVSIGEEQHIPTPQRVFVCKFCSKPFKRKDHYKIHLHIHTGVKSFYCVDCGKGFYRKDHLQKHSLVHAKARVVKRKKELPDLYPINMLHKQSVMSNGASYVKPEITITAPLNAKLRLPLQIKVPYQMVTATHSGEQRAVTVTPQ